MRPLDRTHRTSTPLAAATLAVALASCASAIPVGAEDGDTAYAAAHVEALCHAWTETPCLLRVAGTLHGAESREALAGMRLTFVSGGKEVCSALTDENGRASCVGIVPSGRRVAESGYRIRFDGDGRFDPASAEGISLLHAGARAVEVD